MARRRAITRKQWRSRARIVRLRRFDASERDIAVELAVLRDAACIKEYAETIDTAAVKHAYRNLNGPFERSERHGKCRVINRSGPIVDVAGLRYHQQRTGNVCRMR